MSNEPSNYFDRWFRSRIEQLPEPGVQDWSVFESKLDKALTARRNRRAWFVSGIATALLVAGLWNFMPNQGAEVRLFRGAALPAGIPAALGSSESRASETTPAETMTQTEAEAPAPVPTALGSTETPERTPAPEPAKVALREAAPAQVTPPKAQPEIQRPVIREPSDPYVLPNESWKQAAAITSDLIPEGANIILSKSPTVHEMRREGSFPPEEIEPLFRERDRWSFSLSVYPSFSFRELQLNPSAQNQVHKDYLQVATNSEQGGMAINAGLDIKYHLGRNLFLGSGIYFIQNKINGAYNFTVTEEAVRNLSSQEIIGYEATNRHVEFGVINTFNYLNLPVHLSYQPWASKRIRLNLEGGMSLLMFMGASGKGLHYQTLSEVDISQMYYQNFVGSMDFKVGVNYYLSPRLAVGAEPTLMWFMGSIYARDFALTAVPYNVGINLNIKLKLR